jgi:hypothetical protein
MQSNCNSASSTTSRTVFAKTLPPAKLSADDFTLKTSQRLSSFVNAERRTAESEKIPMPHGALVGIRCYCSVGRDCMISLIRGYHRFGGTVFLPGRLILAPDVFETYTLSVCSGVERIPSQADRSQWRQGVENSTGILVRGDG